MSSHQDFVKNNSAERYVLHQLKGEDEVLFEEHLLFCNICLEEVQRLSQSREVINGFATSNDNVLTIKPNNTPKDSQIGFYIKIAAGILLVIAASWGVMVYFGTKKDAGEKLIAKRDIPEQIISSHKDTIKKNQVADNLGSENYNEYYSFETLMGREYRSEEIEVTSPLNAASCKVGENIEFRWSMKETDRLNLVIFNNKGKIMFEKQVAPCFAFKNTLNSGLYYWQLETEKEAIYTGKFIIK